MSFYGDLATIDLADVLQNLEVNRRTGTLRIQGERGAAVLYVDDGHIAMMAAEYRRPVLDQLAARGFYSEEQLDAARKKRRGSKKSVGETLIAYHAIDAEQLRQGAEESLVEDVCNLLATADGKFELEEEPVPARVFDPEERRLRLALSVSPLVMEAARRSDHWVLIRKIIPSDSAYFVAQPGVECPDDVGDKEFGDALFEALDGTRSVRDTVALFPGQRFAAYQLLSYFVQSRLVRAMVGEELVSVARSIHAGDSERARKIVQHGLEAEPHQLELLELSARMAEEAGDATEAANAHKVLAHLKLESGQREETRAELEAARGLTPGDTSVRERLLSLAIEDGRSEDAIQEGLQLVGLYREPGLHAKVLDVLQRLLVDEPKSIELRRELARCQVDMGDIEVAVRGLVRCGRGLIAGEQYIEARQVFGDVISIDATHEEAAETIQGLDQETFRQRREQRRQLKRLTLLASIGVLALVFFLFEMAARISLVGARQRIAERQLIEQRLYREAVTELSEVQDRFPFTPTAWYDIRRAVQSLQARLHDLGASVSEPGFEAAPGTAQDDAEATTEAETADAESGDSAAPTSGKGKPVPRSKFQHPER